MKKVLLRFVFRGGSDLCTIMDEVDARKIISRWHKGEYSGSRISDHTGWWSVANDDVVGVHYVEYQQPSQQALPLPRSPWEIATSRSGS